ncbi:hypothetical protein CUPL110328_18275 [Cupriavidus plantarum]
MANGGAIKFGRTSDARYSGKRSYGDTGIDCRVLLRRHHRRGQRRVVVRSAAHTGRRARGCGVPRSWQRPDLRGPACRRHVFRIDRRQRYGIRPGRRHRRHRHAHHRRRGRCHVLWQYRHGTRGRGLRARGDARARRAGRKHRVQRQPGPRSLGFSPAECHPFRRECEPDAACRGGAAHRVSGSDRFGRHRARHRDQDRGRRGRLPWQRRAAGVRLGDPCRYFGGWRHLHAGRRRPLWKTLRSRRCRRRSVHGESVGDAARGRRRSVARAAIDRSGWRHARGIRRAVRPRRARHRTARRCPHRGRGHPGVGPQCRTDGRGNRRYRLRCHARAGESNDGERIAAEERGGHAGHHARGGLQRWHHDLGGHLAYRRWRDVRQPVRSHRQRRRARVRSRRRGDLWRRDQWPWHADQARGGRVAADGGEYLYRPDHHRGRNARVFRSE